jgi:hypothetical protein
MLAAIAAASDPRVRAQRAAAAQRAGRERFGRDANIARAAELLIS